MAGNTLGKIALDKGLTFQDKVVFGWLNGCYVTLTRLWDISRFHVYLPDNPDSDDPAAQGEMQRQNALLRAEAVRALEEALAEYKLRRTRSFSGDQSVGVEFGGNIKAMNRLGDFIETATAKVAALGIVSAKICSHCHKAIEYGEVPVRIKGDVFPMHDNCADSATQSDAWNTEPKKGSLLLGILGAALAALVGSVAWAAVYAVGYMVSIVGFLIGVMVSKGYDLLHGRKGRIKVAVVLLFVLLSVVLGQVAGTSFSLIQVYDDTEANLAAHEYMTVTRMEFLQIMWTQDIWAEPEAVGAMVKDLGLGIFFALLGCFGLFRQMARDTAPLKPKRMMVSQ